MPYARKLFNTLNEAYAPLYGFSKLTPKQIDYYINMYIPMLRYDLVTIVTRDEDDEVVAFGISLPSLSKAMQKAKGHLFPFGWIHLLKALKSKPKVVDLYLMGVLPEYQSKGVNALLFNDLIPIYNKLGVEYAESNPELETNNAVQAQWDYFKGNIIRLAELSLKDRIRENMDELNLTENNGISSYNDEDIKTLDWMEHIRKRPGMYIGKLGDGSHADDGIYVLLKEVLDNSIDEYMMGFGKTIEVTIADGMVSVRDYGRGVPLGKVVDVSSKMNTGAKYDNKAFKKSVGLNGVGIKAVNALSSLFRITSWRDGESKKVEYSKAVVTRDSGTIPSKEPNGTLVTFVPDDTIFKNYQYKEDFIEPLLKNYVFLNSGLTILYNGKKYYSRHGLVDLLNEYLTSEPLYPIIHLKGEDIEVVITHCNQYGEEYYSFVNGQHTTQGGTHLSAFKEAIGRVIKEYYNKNFEYTDIRAGIVAAISIKVEEPVFESQTKTKLGSKDMGPNGPTVTKFINDFLKKNWTITCTSRLRLLISY